MIVANLGRQHRRSLNSYFKSSYEYLYLFGVTSYYFIPSISLKLVAHITHVFVFPQYKYDTSIIRHVFLCFPDVSYQRGRTCVTFSFMKLPRKGILESTKSRTQAHIRFAPEGTKHANSASGFLCWKSSTIQEGQMLPPMCQKNYYVVGAT